MQSGANGWPTERPQIKFGNVWRHGGVREVAYLYVWTAWQKIVDDAEIKNMP